MRDFLPLHYEFSTGKMAEFEVTGISYQIGRGLPREEATAAAYYNLDGTLLDTPQKGINIVRMSNGTTRKVLVK